MKIASYFLLFVFLTFITLPTLIKIFDNSTDVTAIFNVSDEEESGKPFSKLKDVVKVSKISISIVLNYHKAKQIITANCIFYDAVTRKLISPPPEFLI